MTASRFFCLKERGSKRLSLLSVKNGKSDTRVVLPLLGDLNGDKQHAAWLCNQAKMEGAWPRAIALK